MKIQELKNWIDNLPEEFADFEVVTSEEGVLVDDTTYRKDVPIIALNVDTESNEILLYSKITN